MKSLRHPECPNQLIMLRKMTSLQVAKDGGEGRSKIARVWASAQGPSPGSNVRFLCRRTSPGLAERIGRLIVTMDGRTRGTRSRFFFFTIEASCGNLHVLKPMWICLVWFEVSWYPTWWHPWTMAVAGEGCFITYVWWLVMAGDWKSSWFLDLMMQHASRKVISAYCMKLFKWPVVSTIGS